MRTARRRRGGRARARRSRCRRRRSAPPGGTALSPAERARVEGPMTYPDALPAAVERSLDGLRFETAAAASGLEDAMRYSLMAGGKRIRPVLALATARALRTDPAEVMPLAAAIELIHTYSLIHDDLPAMD